MITEAAHARPGRPKSQEKRDAIRQAAVRLFMSEGLQRTSMDAIAAEAGVSKQTVYSHFDSKDALFRECVRTKVTDYGLEAEAIPPETPAAEALHAFGRQFMELLQDQEVLSMFRLLAGECPSYPSIARVFYEAGPGQNCEFLGSLLSRFAERGELVLDDPLEAASMLMAMFKAHYFLELLLRVRETIEPEELEHHLQRTVRRFLALHGSAGSPREQGLPTREIR
ncbi:TetR/AcrR family transcriptional regulator [Lentisalinibacter orientalis]|uniref:TetR/AcrR family transcriptional regulator n=1 Tax=Lentisalinibacter orientalis TaxID=2992241 RepID=UPI00386DAFE7